MELDRFIHGIKKEMGTGLEKLSDGIKKIKEPAQPPKMTLSVCMLGPRGVGKTSVITSMYNSQKEAVSGSNLFLIAEGDTKMILDDKKNQLIHTFQGLHDEGSLVKESGIPGDSSESLFCFTYGMNSERVNIDLEIRDYPGEYLKREPQIVADYIREASAVMIAIDTPCMMEAGGRYNEGKNTPQLVMDFLMDNLENEEEKLILFVPLKCEKYFQENRIDEVTKRVQENYAGLIEYLRDRENTRGFKKKVCCAITPIQTLGGIAFDSFEKAPGGTIEEFTARDGRVLPARIFYHYTSADAVYSPKYCVQPLYYLLSFVSKQYQRMQNQEKVSGWFGKLREALRLIPNVDAFMMEIASMGIQRIDGTQGYKILFGRGRI